MLRCSHLIQRPPRCEGIVSTHVPPLQALEGMVHCSASLHGQLSCQWGQWLPFPELLPCQEGHPRRVGNTGRLRCGPGSGSATVLDHVASHAGPHPVLFSPWMMSSGFLWTSEPHPSPLASSSLREDKVLPLPAILGVGRGLSTE